MWRQLTAHAQLPVSFDLMWATYVAFAGGLVVGRSDQMCVSLLQARIDKFDIEVDPNQLPGGSRLFFIRGEAIERFAQMTNWDYYEAVKRFQRVLEVSGINEALKAAGIAAGDTVALGDMGEFVWSDDQSEAATYGAWLEDMEARGRNRQGGSKWPTPKAARGGY